MVSQGARRPLNGPEVPRPGRSEAAPVRGLVVARVGDLGTAINPFPRKDELTQFARQHAPRCLTQAERKLAGLGLDPPAWCLSGTGPANWEDKWPYNSREWKRQAI